MTHVTLSALARPALVFILAIVSMQATAYYPPYGYQQPGYLQQQPGYAQQQPGYPQQQPGYPQQQPGYVQQPGYPQQYPDNRSSGQPQYWYPYQQQAPVYQPPVVETSVSDQTPYEQQSLVYSIRVIGSGNLKTVVPELPQSSAVVLRKLGDPVTETDPQDQQRIVTEFRYLLMPLSSGTIEVPPVRVTGHYSTSGGGEGPPFEVTGERVMMQVRAATDAVQPWLPLYNLQITARIRGNQAPAAGNPIELEIETKAVGATGSQIPSVAAFLDSEDFRIYPGESITEGNVASDGRTLRGRRVENFTLVPRYGGWLSLPGVSVNWWNVRYNRPEVAALLTDKINVMGPTNPERDGSISSSLTIPALFWIPMFIAIAILLVGWLSAFMGDGRLPGTESIKNLFRPVLGELYAPMVEFANRFSPRRSFHRLRTWTGRQLPVSWKLWFCLRAVARENDPAEWATALQILAAKHLGVRPHSHLRQLGEGIVRCHPHANAEQVDRLLVELDEAVYGNKPIRSFPRWKRDFRTQIKPGLLPIPFRQRLSISRGTAKLPQLNPR